MKKEYKDFIFYALAVLTGLLWLFLLASTSSASACSNFISESEFQKSLDGLPARAGCKKNERCFCYDGVDLAISKIGLKEVDDRSKPIYEYAEFETYEYEDFETEETVIGQRCPQGFERSFSKNDCQRLLGYEQKEVEALIVDEQRKEQVLLKRAQREAQKLAQKQEQARFDNKMKILIDEFSRGNGNIGDGQTVENERFRLRARGLLRMIEEEPED